MLQLWLVKELECFNNNNSYNNNNDSNDTN